MVTHTQRERDTHTDALTPVNTPHGHTHRERDIQTHLRQSTPHMVTHACTGAGSLKDAPMMAGLIIAVGRSAASLSRTYSANPFV